MRVYFILLCRRLLSVTTYTLVYFEIAVYVY